MINHNDVDIWFVAEVKVIQYYSYGLHNKKLKLTIPCSFKQLANIFDFYIVNYDMITYTDVRQ